MLNAYIAQVQSLLDDAGAVEYTVPNLTIYINDARVQIALASECIRFVGRLGLTANVQPYNFGLITGIPAGVQGALVVRKASVQTPSQWTEIHDREWEWFWSNCLNGPLSVTTGTPNTFSQFQPGVGGVVFFSPNPSTGFNTRLDCVGYPINLIDDTTPESLLYPWTEAVQYYAAYLAFLNAQRNADADAMLQRYDLFQTRATQVTAPTTLPVNYPGQGGAAIAGEARPITAQRGGQR
jgi:hypothetical protein